MWRRGNPCLWRQRSMVRIRAGPFFVNGNLSSRQKICVCFFASLLTAAPSSPKIWAFFLELKKNIFVSGFGFQEVFGFQEGIEFQEVLPIFFRFLNFFHAVHKKIWKIVSLQIQGVFCAFSAVVIPLLETTNPLSSISLGTCFLSKLKIFERLSCLLILSRLRSR